MTERSVGGPGADDRSDEDSGAVRRRWDGQCTPSVAVIEAVAAATGREPTELPLLEGTVDPEAIDALFDGRGGAPERAAYLSFSYAGADVTLGDDGEVTARPREGAR